MTPLQELVLEMGRIIRRLDEDNEYLELWTQDGDYVLDGRWGGTSHRCANTQGDKMTPEQARAWLAEAARYFENRPTRGEDRAHWTNVTNAAACRKIAELITALRATRVDREYFAAHALTGLLANDGGPIQRDASCGWSYANCDRGQVAKEAYALADAMLALVEKDSKEFAR